MAVVAPASLWRRERSRRLIIQAGFLAFSALVALYIANRATRLDLDFDFLQARAGFSISHQWLTGFTGNDNRVAAFVTATVNTVRLVAVGLVLTTVLGVLMGVARLSKNWLVAKIALVYVEVFRNTPLLIQIIFWYTAVLLRLPPIDRGIEAFEAIFLSNRALGIPWVEPRGLAAPFFAVLAVAAVAAWFLRRWRIGVEDRTGQPGRGNSYALALFLAVSAIAFFALGMPLEVEQAQRVVTGTGIVSIQDGMSVSPEFTALLLALVIYTGSFIAEIVRGSILALPRGQNEAAMALGLSGYQRMTLVILPQALRIMIPPVTNQYLNLTKNSSLAVAIAYPEIVFVARTIQNNAGHAVPIFILVMATYLALSAIISAFMNWLNRRVTLVGN